MSEWNRLTWGEVSDLRYGKALRGYKDGDGPTQVFGTNGPIGHTAEEPLATGPRPVVGRKGAYRGVHLAAGPFWVIDTAYWLEPRASLDPVFAYYALLGVDINGMDSGSALPSLTRDHFYGVPLVLPPLEEQERIAGVLGAFDDLIETNRRLASDLAALQQAAFTATNREPSTVGECAEFLNRRRVPLSKAQREANPGKYPYYGATGVMDSVGDYLFDGVHVLVGEDGTVVDSVGHPIVQVPHGRYWVNNHAHVLSGRTVSTDVLAVALRATTVGHVITGAVQAKLSMGNLKTVAIDLPTDLDVRSALDSLGSGIRTLEDETTDLTRQRDELLPLLMSGKVRVRAVEAAVS